MWKKEFDNQENAKKSKEINSVIDYMTPYKKTNSETISSNISVGKSMAASTVVMPSSFFKR